MSIDLGTETVELDTAEARSQIEELGTQVRKVNDSAVSLFKEVNNQMATLDINTIRVMEVVQESALIAERENLQTERELRRNETNQESRMRFMQRRLRQQETELLTLTSAIKNFIQTETVNSKAVLETMGDAAEKNRLLFLNLEIEEKRKLKELNRQANEIKTNTERIVITQTGKVKTLATFTAAQDKTTQSVVLKGMTLMNSVMIAVMSFSDVIGETATRSLSVMVATLSSAMSAYQMMAAVPWLAPFAVPAAIAIGAAIGITSLQGMGNVQRQVNAMQSAAHSGLQFIGR
jgi:hypothetical protein